MGPVSMLLASLIVLAGGVAPSLTSTQRQTMERMFACPAALPDDDARILAVRHFVERYGALAPRSTIAERMAFHDHLVAEKRCPEMDHDLIHTFPEL